MFYAAITPLLPELRDELGLGKGGAGVLAAAYAAGTFAGALPGGWIAARLGVRVAVFAGLALMGLAGLAFAFGHSVVLLDGARFLQGVGGACSWSGGLAWLAAAAPRDRRGEVLGTALGAAIVGGQLGPVVGGGPRRRPSGRVLGDGGPRPRAGRLGRPHARGAGRGPVRGAAEALARPPPRRRAVAHRPAVGGLRRRGRPRAAAPRRARRVTRSALGLTFFAAAGVEAIVNPGRRAR